jgi:hypothetical protein
VNTSADILRGNRPFHGITRLRVNRLDLKGEVFEVDWILWFRIGSNDRPYESDSRPIRFH